MCVSTSYGSLELLLLVTFFRHFLASLINADEQGRFRGGIFFCFVSGAVELESSVSAVALSVSVSAVFSSDWLGSFSASMNTDMRFHLALSWGNSYPWETYIPDVNVAKYGSDICLGEQISLGKCVRGHTFPGGTHITVTPAAVCSFCCILRSTLLLLLSHNSDSQSVNRLPKSIVVLPVHSQL